MICRAASLQDFEQIDALLVAAFGGRDEVRLMQGLRAANDLALEQIAVQQQEIVGHIAFSTVTGPDRGLALAPLSVSPSLQGQGIGSELTRQSLDLARQQGWRSVFVLGDPGYYRRFGFSLEAAKPFQSPYSGEHFMVLELVEDGLTGQKGQLSHAPIFAQLEGGE
ncbi:MAG: GNAT family N-acetyltransferase [Rhizobiaceae bacterium]|nr:GNAT family N-acetyltransferase [Rhizobiaceae bacterium]